MGEKDQSAEDLAIAARWGIGTLRDARGLIRVARELVATPRRWTKYTLARDRKGRPVVPGNVRPRPASWCLLGSLLEAEHRRSGKRFLSEEESKNLHVPVRLTLAVQATMIGCLAEFLEERDAAAGDTSGDDFLEGGVSRVSEPVSVLLSRANDAPETTHEDVLRALEFADGLITMLLQARERRSRGGT